MALTVLSLFLLLFTFHLPSRFSANVNSSALVATAFLIAWTLYILANENEDVPDSTFAAINVNVSLVEQLMGCLLDCDPGLSFELVKKFISRLKTCPSHYVSVILDEPSSTPFTGYINDVPRFVWNLLADKTSIIRGNNSSGCPQGCGKDEVCIKAETEGKGVCVLSSTSYVPAYSTWIKFESGGWNVLPPNFSDKMGIVDPVWTESKWIKYESGGWNVLPPNFSDKMGIVDPVWTESNWNTIGKRVYTIQSAAYVIVLFCLEYHFYSLLIPCNSNNKSLFL